jgi:hypothetical protein
MSIHGGDQACLIRDSLVAVVRRRVKVTGSFLLVGEAYLYGFTYGRLLESRWGMTEKMETVVICMRRIFSFIELISHSKTLLKC